ncbi:hypothetical protein TIFTF001_034942 [Ficus carica]|uniref:Uncharacterized protein n=1 Tax=Ficus carica TaxID=3494 RepID=A0AA88E1F1_FICCA|nr:hypothetical protein TIFTF001_034942 [Ficus carica]
MEEGTSNLALIFRVYCKVMNTINPDINIKSLIKDNKGTTTMFQTNLAKFKVAIPKRISWNEISFPESWTLEKASNRDPPQNCILNQITELIDGTVEISFSNQRKKQFSPPRLSDFTSQSPLDLGKIQQKPTLPRISSEFEISGTHENPNGISNPVYKPQDPSSPTPSDMGYNNICVLERSNEKIDKKRLIQMFYS